MDEETPSPPPSAKPSQTPSWAMLGFVLGALFVLALPRRQPEALAPARPPAHASAAVRSAPPRLTTIEAVFAGWSQYAVWENGLTEVALWNADTRAYSDCFEVLRSGDGYFFRSIPKLTRVPLTHGVTANSPLLFTETEEQRQEWLGQKTQEGWHALGESMRPGSVPPK